MSEFPCKFQSSMVYQKSLISWFQPPAVNNCTLVPSVYTIHQEGPTPKDLTPATRFQQYKETTVHRYMCYHCLCRNPDKHTWKWKTTGRSCRKKNAFTSTSNHFAYYLRNWPLSFHHGTNGIQRSANSLLTLVNSSSSSLQGTWEQNGQMVKQTKQTARKTKDLPIIPSTTVTQNNSFSAYFGRFKKSLDRKQQEKPVGRKSFLKAPKSRKSEEQSHQSQSNRTRCMTLVYCGTLVGIGNSMETPMFYGRNDHPVFHIPDERVVLVFEVITCDQLLQCASKISGAAELTSWHWGLLEGDG